LVKLNLVPSDDKLRLRGNALRQAIAKDKENGLIPFYVSVIYHRTSVFVFTVRNFSFVQHWVQLELVLLIILLNLVRYVRFY